MKLVKAGESHGVAMVGILTNVPSGVPVSENFINNLLAQRCESAGRSERQRLECDKLDLITGVRGGFTIGNNLAVQINNAVHGDYALAMHPFNADLNQNQIRAIRPGHADLPGCKRNCFSDARNVLEGSSARNTCLDVAGGAIALQMLEALGISISAFVTGIGDLFDNNGYSYQQISGVSAPYFTANKQFESGAKQKIEYAKSQGNSLGGSLQIRVTGLKAGFGSYLPEKRLDASIAQLFMGVQAVKGVYFGKNPFENLGFGTDYVGSAVLANEKLQIQNSQSGGIDGGMSNGDEIVITVGVKPIPTTQRGVQSVDMLTNEPCVSAKERADVTAVFALCPILKCKLALAISEAITERLGADCMQNIKERYQRLC